MRDSCVLNPFAMLFDLQHTFLVACGIIQIKHGDTTLFNNPT